MSEEQINKVRNAVSQVNDPHMGISIVEMGLVQSIDVDGNEATIVIKPTNPVCMSITRMAIQARSLAEEVEGIDKANIVIEGHRMEEAINEMVNQ